MIAGMIRGKYNVFNIIINGDKSCCLHLLSEIMSDVIYCQYMFICKRVINYNLVNQHDCGQLKRGCGPWAC